MQQLVEYFHGPRSWSELCELYLEHGTHYGYQVAIRHCKGRELPIRDVLEQELEELVKTVSSGPSDHFREPTKMIVEEETNITLEIPAGTSLAELEARRIDLWKQANTLHAQLKVMPNDKARLLIANKLKEVWIKVDLNWYALDFYKLHRRTPEVYLDGDWLTHNLAILYRILLNKRSLVSKLRGKLKKAKQDTELFNQLSSKLLSFETEIASLTLVITNRQ